MTWQSKGIVSSATLSLKRPLGRMFPYFSHSIKDDFNNSKPVSIVQPDSIIYLHFDLFHIFFKYMPKGNIL